ncbi:MAG: sortase [Actinomycetota bacterium]|nr:sortase [Actinomycetota bacterium]
MPLAAGLCGILLLTGCAAGDDGADAAGGGSPTAATAPAESAPADTAPADTEPSAESATPGREAQPESTESSGGESPSAAPTAEADPGESAAPPPDAAVDPVGPAAPSRLIIPAMDLDEGLIDLGIASDGSMEVPEDAAEVGWFTGGGRPGGKGPTVLAGHVDDQDGPAVFFRLPELQPGDEVQVESADGAQTTYVVDRAAEYSKGKFPTGEVFGATMDDQLRLITCTGPWDSLAQSYSGNHVVFLSPQA